MIRIGIDFGGTKIEVAALAENGDFLCRIRAPNPGSYDGAIRTVAELIHSAESQIGVTGATIGVGMPGSVSPKTGLIRNANSVYLNGRNFAADVEAALGRPVRLSNDANCLALSESVDGAGAGLSPVFAVILGTGCGGGVTVDGKLVEGISAIAGEWGHNPLPWPDMAEVPGPACWCGQQGCLETWISGTGFGADYHAHGGDAIRGQDIIARMRDGEAAAVAAFDRYVSRLGRALASICNLIDPAVIVLGGGMSNVPELYERVPPVVTRYIFSDVWQGQIRPAKWGDSSGVRGAAWLWPDPGAGQAK
ncbi:MAG: ROK family protein [Rhizomicrobium sp.]